MGNLHLSMQRLLSASLSSSTHLVYRNALATFRNFRQSYSLCETWPAPVNHLTLFISFCFEMGYSPSTITTFISGVSFYHKIHQREDPTDAFIIRKLIEGCKRLRKRQDIRAPITESILTKICQILPNICFSFYEACLFRAAFLLAYYGLLRVSEIVFTNKVQADRPLLASDIQTEGGSKALLVSIRVSKTNQSGPPTILRIPVGKNHNLCCVSAIQRYLSLRPIGPPYLFVHSNGKPLTRSQFCGVLAKTIRSLGLPSQLYPSHSFRIGRATTLAAQCISNETIKKLGRWKSNAVERYIRF